MSYLTNESSFCKNCDNFMDITNNISNKDNTDENYTDEEQNDEEQNDEEQNDEEQNEGLLNDNITESSDYDVSMSIGGSIDINSETDNNIKNILNGNNSELTLFKNFNINDLNKYPLFNKLSNEQKTLVINRILEKIPKQKNNTKENIYTLKESYFYCKSCGYNEKIQNKKFIFSRGDEKKDEQYNFLNYVNDNILPMTKNYNCINDKCTTHKNPETKMAIFYRFNNSYNTRYICKVCNKYWNTFVEK